MGEPCPIRGCLSSALTKRVVSGIVLAPLVVVCIVAGGWFFMGMVLAAALLAAWEFAGLVRGEKHRYAHVLLVLAYLAACFSSAVFIRFFFDQGAWLALALVLGVWASDTGAYVTGKTLKGPKMAPKLSPNKTWAGLGGAMVFFGLALAALHGSGNSLGSWIGVDTELAGVDALRVFLLGLVLGAVGQGGDLFISFYKRRAGVKDTGRLIPGHGGILDRIDSLLLVSPAFLGILLLWL